LKHLTKHAKRSALEFQKYLLIFYVMFQ